MAAALAAVLLSGPGCNRHRKVRVQTTEEETPQLATVVHVADPRSATQLVSGFYDIEQNSWRWTAGKFSVVLRPPRGAAEKGAVLQLKFSIPDPVISNLKTVSLSAAVQGKPLPPESYTQSGEFTYARDIAPGVLTTDSVKVDFSLSKFLPAGQVDQRELGVVVTSVGFESK